MAAAKQLDKPDNFGSRTAARAESRRQAIFARDVEVEKAKAAATKALADFASADAAEVAAFDDQNQFLAVDIQTRAFFSLAPLVAEFVTADSKAVASKIADVVRAAHLEALDMCGQPAIGEWLVAQAFLEEAMTRRSELLAFGTRQRVWSHEVSMTPGYRAASASLLKQILSAADPATIRNSLVALEATLHDAIAAQPLRAPAADAADRWRVITRGGLERRKLAALATLDKALDDARHAVAIEAMTAAKKAEEARRGPLSSFVHRIIDGASSASDS